MSSHPNRSSNRNSRAPDIGPCSTHNKLDLQEEQRKSEPRSSVSGTSKKPAKSKRTRSRLPRYRQRRKQCRGSECRSMLARSAEPSIRFASAPMAAPATIPRFARLAATSWRSGRVEAGTIGERNHVPIQTATPRRSFRSQHKRRVGEPQGLRRANALGGNPPSAPARAAMAEPPRRGRGGFHGPAWLLSAARSASLRNVITATLLVRE
jgi:hypothetical protein